MMYGVIQQVYQSVTTKNASMLRWGLLSSLQEVKRYNIVLTTGFAGLQVLASAQSVCGLRWHVRRNCWGQIDAENT